MTNPLSDTWKYEYDSQGDRTAETDPEGDKRTWGYNADSQETSTVSPRGHEAGAKESKFTTTTERNARGLPVKITAPLEHVTSEEYDGDNNLVKKTDPESHVTKYSYNADNELTATEEPNKDTTSTEYDGAGQVVEQTDGNGHATKYKRNILEQVEEITDPLGRKTHKEYDPAGNVKSVTDAAGRTTTYKYDPDNRLVEIKYVGESTPNFEYEYNGDGLRTRMVDATGTTTYSYDSLDRLTSTTDGHKDTIDYEYNTGNEQTKITYPNGKAVTREYDKDGRLTSVADWSGNTTKFKYNGDSDLTATMFPAATGDEDKYAYNEADSMSEVKMTKGAETLASLVYARNKDEGVTKATTVGLPGEAAPSFSYDENSRLTKGAAVSYKYDAANNPTTIGNDTLSYNAADEPEKAVNKRVTEATYSYNEDGERTKTTPASGPATTYGYTQAGDLVSVSRPKEGSTPAIEDSYTYNGDGLRMTKTSSGTTAYFAWDVAEGLPLVLNDGTNSYIYGAGGYPIEQAASGGTVTYLHHDQQGSTRLLTNEKGEKVGSATYDGYGNPIGKTGTISPLGYDGEYTDADTGLIYLRARYYDPATAQFLSVDPVVQQTRTPYTYAHDNPLSDGDPTGDDSPTPEEIAFSNWYQKVEGATIAELEKKHATGLVAEYREVASYYYFALKAEIACNDNNYEYCGEDKQAYEKQYVRLAAQIAGDFAPLVKAEDTKGWTGAVRYLAELAKKLWKIHIILHDLPSR
jgi:RHS repeat-associated protein